MMRVIDTSRIPTIKKQIFLVLGLFFSFSNLGASCPQTVGAVTPGESIWQVTSRIGQATNVIESQICALNVVTTDLACSFIFGQADIGSGGIYTISAPGTYCMAENVTFTFGPAITINSSDVTLDLQGHYIDGGSNPESSAIQLATGVGSNLSSIIIQNGAIQNVGAATFAQAISQGGTNSSLANIVIRDMDFYNITGTTGLGFAFRANVQSILIENCMTFNGGAFFVLTDVAGGSAVLRNIRVEQYVHGFAEILVSGAPATLWETVVVEDCILTTSAPVGILAQAYIDVADSLNAVVRNCVVDGGGTVAGFIFQNVNNVVVSDCIAQNVLGEGFTFPLGNSFSLVVERCIAQHNGADGFNFAITSLNSFNVIDCVANNNMFNGFLVQSAVSVGTAIFKNCYAAQNGVCGFLMENALNGVILNSAFEGCVAQGNGGDGFNLDNRSGVLFVNISFNDCISQGNSGGGMYSFSTYLGDGFGVNSASNIPNPRAANSTVNNVVFNNCVAQHNGNDGFDFGAAAFKVDTISCQYCTAQQNDSHGMNFSSTSTNCEVYMSLITNNGGNGINNLNPVFGPSSANRFISNRSFKNVGVDYFQINDGVNGQPFFSSSSEALIQGASAWASLAT